jgi:hypothetical protein
MLFDLRCDIYRVFDRSRALDVYQELTVAKKNSKFPGGLSYESSGSLRAGLHAGFRSITPIAKVNVTIEVVVVEMGIARERIKDDASCLRVDVIIRELILAYHGVSLKAKEFEISLCVSNPIVLDNRVPLPDSIYRKTVDIANH